MKLLMTVIFTYSHEEYHTNRVVFHLLLTSVSLMCLQPCHGLNLNNQDPKLTVVPAGIPTDITALYLNSNEISEIGANNFTGLSYVKRLHLDRNRITHIDDDAFLPCAALLDLRLSYNQLTSLPPTLGPNSPYMLQLNIMENPSCIIEEFWFRQFRSLQSLLMENIGMTELPNDFFTGLISLEMLQISKTSAPNLTERTVNLKHLRFDEHIGSIYPDENFLNLTKLTKMTMSGGDRMTSLPRFLGATALNEIWFLFVADSIPDLSHLINLKKFLFLPANVICDHLLCWTLFESFTFFLGVLEVEHPMAGCRNPQKFKSRTIYSISKLELGCYSSKFFFIQVMVNSVGPSDAIWLWRSW